MGWGAAEWDELVEDNHALLTTYSWYLDMFLLNNTDTWFGRNRDKVTRFELAGVVTGFTGAERLSTQEHSGHCKLCQRSPQTPNVQPHISCMVLLVSLWVEQMGGPQ